MKTFADTLTDDQLDQIAEDLFTVMVDIDEQKPSYDPDTEGYARLERLSDSIRDARRVIVSHIQTREELVAAETVKSLKAA